MARVYHLVYFAVLAFVASAMGTNQTAVELPTYSSLDPEDDPYNPLRYIASNTLTATAFSLVMLVALIQTFYTFRYGAKWMLAMVIGGYVYAVGFACRFVLHDHPDSLKWYITEYLFIVLSPCAFIAANYVLLGQLARYILCPAHLLIPVQKLTPIFLSSDVTTFTIQAIGAGPIVSSDPTLQSIGRHIILAGLVIQLASFTVFSGIYVRFLYRVYTLERDVWERDKAGPWYHDWRALATALAISCVGILVRSGYRVAEFSQGTQGRLLTVEAFFYGLDTLPIFVAISVYVLVWPGWFIKEQARRGYDGHRTRRWKLFWSDSNLQVKPSGTALL